MLDPQARGDGINVPLAKGWSLLVPQLAWSALSAELALKLPQPSSQLLDDTRLSLSAGSVEGHIIVLAAADRLEGSEADAVALLAAAQEASSQHQQGGQLGTQDEVSQQSSGTDVSSSSAPTSSASCGAGGSQHVPKQRKAPVVTNAAATAPAQRKRKPAAVAGADTAAPAMLPQPSPAAHVALPSDDGGTDPVSPGGTGTEASPLPAPATSRYSLVNSQLLPWHVLSCRLRPGCGSAQAARRAIFSSSCVSRRRLTCQQVKCEPLMSSWPPTQSRW